MKIVMFAILMTLSSFAAQDDQRKVSPSGKALYNPNGVCAYCLGSSPSCVWDLSRADGGCNPPNCRYEIIKCEGGKNGFFVTEEPNNPSKSGPVKFKPKNIRAD